MRATAYWCQSSPHDHVRRGWPGKEIRIATSKDDFMRDEGKQEGRVEGLQSRKHPAL